MALAGGVAHEALICAHTRTVLRPRRKVGASMHRRLVKSFATMMGASVLLVAPIALGAPALAAVVAAEQVFLEPDDVVPFSIEATDPDFWERYLADEGYADAVCSKDDSPGDSPYEVPDLRIVLAVVILNDGMEMDTANEVYLRPPTSGLIEHDGLLHAIVCTPGQPGPLPTSTAPVVETDRVGDTGGIHVALVLAAGAIAAGAGALLLGRRRQRVHS